MSKKAYIIRFANASFSINGKNYIRYKGKWWFRVFTNTLREAKGEKLVTVKDTELVAVIQRPWIDSYIIDTIYFN